MKILEDKVLPGLERSLDLTWRRNEAISSNVANAETPQYRAVDLNFAGELRKAFGEHGNSIKKTSPKHLDITNDGSSHLVPDLSGATKADGNNVDIDIQMGELAFNSGKYASAGRMLRKKLGMLRLAIREGGR